MKALVARAYGPPESYELAELPVPEPGPGQLQVRVAAAALNAADLRLPAGDFREVAPLTFPHVPGNDFAGTVTAVGDGVSAYRVGDEVFGFALPRVLRAMAGPRPSLGTGALAEYVVVEADTPFIAHRPAGLDPVAAAALPIVGSTALALLHHAAVRPGGTVLVIGATGGVGTTVLPLLAAAGARVLATATPDDGDLLRDLGATEVLDYRAADPVGEALRRYPSGVDLVVNLVLPSDDLTGPARALRPGGRLLTITFPPPGPDAAGRDDVTVTLVLDMAGEHGAMREVAGHAAAGRLRATIGRSHPLDEAGRACVEFAREHTTGKVVVTMA
ncbi:NADP-dependent oxidoreductase [Longispora urticae]